MSAINCAYAGFVYVHKYAQPVLQCLECEVMMLNSMPAVDMMIEHASCSPVCPFISKVKGVDYFKHAIEIRNIALKKAGKPALNVRAMDVKYALKGKGIKSNLSILNYLAILCADLLLRVNFQPVNCSNYRL